MASSPLAEGFALQAIPNTTSASLSSLVHFDLDIINTFQDDNTTLNSTNATITEPFESPYELWQAILIGILLSSLCIGTVLGNVLVCTAVGIVRKLRTPSNLLIVSLAVSDFLVGLLVMPFAMMYELMGQWVLPKALCDTWTSLDVLLCTASILNLCAISIDRYYVITRPFQYAMKRTPKRMALMVACVWLSSGIISIPPLFGWKSDSPEGQCAVSQAIGYQFYATIGAFYLPLAVMIFVYYRIYMVSSKIAQAEAKSNPAGVGSYPHSGMTTPRKNSEENHNAIYPNGSVPQKGDDSTMEMLPKPNHHIHNPIKKPRVTFNLFKKSSLNKISNSKERKATKTLGVIMGAFTACWLPFFILALIRPFCGECIPGWLSAVFLWLGYANSFLNPVIYARFNRDFRTPFKEIILCRCRGINIRLRSESYAEQYGRGSSGGPAALRDCLRPPQDTVVRYNSQGQTIVRLGNGKAASGKEEKVAVANI